MIDDFCERQESTNFSDSPVSQEDSIFRDEEINKQSIRRGRQSTLKARGRVVSTLQTDKMILFIFVTQLPSMTTKSKLSVVQQILIVLIGLIVMTNSAGITAAETHISTDRNPHRASICGYYSANYSTSEIASSQKYIDQYNYMTAAQVEAILFSNNYGEMQTQTLLIVMPHLIAFIVLCILWIPLCCCCVWPEKHPVCRKCRKPDKEMYGKCELKWTAYCSVVWYLAIIVGAILGIMKGADIVYYFNDVGCKTAAIADDTVYGRLSPTVENRFFVGLSPLSSDLTTFKSSFSTIWTQNTNSLQNANQVATKQNVFELFEASIYSGYTNPTYSTAFSSDGTTYVNVNSEFKTLFYGPTTNSTTILGYIYSVTNNIFEEINAVLDPMIAAYNNLTATTQATVEAQMDGTITSIGTLSITLNSFINNWANLFSNQSFLDQIVLMIKIIYGAFFGLALLGFLAAVILACCSVVKVRLIMYFACSFMFFLAFFSFVCMILLAVLAPNVSQICGYLDAKLSTGAGTQDLFSKLGYPTLGDLYVNCMTDGTGWAMDKIGPTFNTSFSDLLLITQSVQQFNIKIPSYSSANLVAPFTAGIAKVQKVQNAELLDVTSTIALNFISGVRQISYSIDPSCNLLNVQGDSWMPSFSLYSCPGGKAQNAPCLNLASTAVCALGCYEIMNQLQSASGDSSYNTTLATRYGASCNYYTYIVNLQNNWNYPRWSSMNLVLTDLSNLQTKVTDYDNTFKTTQASISTYSTILETNYNGLTNLTSGSFNGLDCRVLGESIVDMRNSICVGMLSGIYYNLICLILVSYGVLMAACCTVCAGVRHFRHLQKMQIHVGYKGVPVSISDTKIFDK